MKATVLLQGITPHTHVSAVKRVLSIEDAERIVINVAFMNAAGLSAICSHLAPVAKRTTILAGVRNGITSAQGLAACLDLGCLTYAVDTGSRRLLFHPKVYFSRNSTEARLVVGSANLTLGGLNSNIEASIFAYLNLNAPSDAKFVSDLEGQLNSMVVDYPDHVFLLPNRVAIDRLLDSGRVVDETAIRWPVTSGHSTNSDLDTMSRIPLKTSPIAVARISNYQRDSQSTTITLPSPQLGADATATSSLNLVWKSKPLTRRPLTIPTGSNTNPTGSMLFTKGALAHIDQRKYFRDDVFDSLQWDHDARPSRQHIERATASFHFIIGNVTYPTFDLEVSHNTRTDTKAYEQRNGMTNLHWGDARRLVKREELLGRSLFLYRDTAHARHFVIEID